MPSKMPDFITRILSEGTSSEKRVEAAEIRKSARVLIAKMPPAPDRQIYVGNLLRQALCGELDVEVFKEFVRLTNTYMEVVQVAPRVKMLIEKRRRKT